MKRFIVLILFLFSFLQSFAQFGFWGSMIGSQSTYPLDQYAGGKVGYSPRKLKTGVTTPLRVRRSSDNAEQDASFSGDNLNESALLSFCGSGDCFVTALYDQSGNGAHMYQSTASAQPKIVSSGTVIKVNSRPTLLFDGTNDFMVCSTGNEGYFTFLHDGTQYYMFSVQQFGIVADPNAVYALLASSNAVSTSLGGAFRYDDRASQSVNQSIRIVIGNGATSVVSTLGDNNPSITNTLSQLTFAMNPSNATANDRAGFRINGSSEIKGNVATGSVSATSQTTATRIGAITTGTNFLSGYLSELIIFQGDQSGNRSAIEANQKAYFGTP